MKQDLRTLKKELSHINKLTNQKLTDGYNFFMTSKLNSFDVTLIGYTEYSFNIKCTIKHGYNTYIVPKVLTTADEIYSEVERYILDN